MPWCCLVICVKKPIAFKLTFGVDGVNVLEHQNRCDISIERRENAPFMIGVHCMNHHTNLAIQTFSQMGIVRKIENVLQSLYAYFFHNQKITQ
jgi:hypothetical protein